MSACVVLIIDVWDAARRTWRHFTAEPTYTPRCGNGLHQFAPGKERCVCGHCTRGRVG